mgnify:CR=1 FL=1
MTIKEYLEENKMTYKVLAELVGCSQATITNAVKYGKGLRKQSVIDKLKELGIEVRIHDTRTQGQKKKPKESRDDYLYQEKLQISRFVREDIYCYSLKKVNELTKYLNEKKVCYYVREVDGYWIVKYDRTLKEEEWIV